MKLVSRIGGMRNAYKILVGNSVGKDLLGDDHESRWGTMLRNNF
jgi:hypothetical protein